MERFENMDIFRPNNGDFGGKKSNILKVHQLTSPLFPKSEVPYIANFDRKNDFTAPENSSSWNFNQNISIS
jgi:hypothetical protein